ncbi:hypothetical protein [Halobaculum marinum]|uniref:Uncharacterized protein n=1 Tax=Halobaculum marinum TaxID=3031996 RepID=A0ABD5X215_9EURY|nr:hypothetical protein [Halobaculum sp. DT55]
MVPIDVLQVFGVVLATDVPLFGSLPGGGALATALLLRLVPTVVVAGLVGWDAGRQSANPRAWPTAAVLVGVASLPALVVVAALYLVAGRDDDAADGGVP